MFNGQAIEFTIQFFIDSFINTIQAFMWPVYVVQFSPPWGAVGLGLAFVGFARYLKSPIETWMFSDAPEADTDAK